MHHPSGVQTDMVEVACSVCTPVIQYLVTASKCMSFLCTGYKQSCHRDPGRANE